MWPFSRREKKSTGNSLVQYSGGVYLLGSSGKTRHRIKSYVEGYKNCDTVFSCVNLIVQAALNVPWYVYRTQGDEIVEVERHPLCDWMKEPGPGLDWKEFCERSFSYFQAAGNNYIRKVIGSQAKFGKVEVLQPQLVEIKFDRNAGAITTYDYRVGCQVWHFQPNEIIHVKTFNPDDPLYGLSKVDAIARQVDISKFGQEWTISLLEHEARPSGALKVTSGRMSDDQRERLKTEFEQKFSGYENAGRPLVLEGDLEWIPFSISPKELEFLNSEKVNTRKICAAFAVPPELLGDNENKTYSNVKEARKAVYQEAVMPMLEKFKAALNRSVARDFDKSGTYFLDFDTSDIDALSEDIAEKVQYLQTADWLTTNEKREQMGFDVVKDPAADKVLVSYSRVPIDQLTQTVYLREDEPTDGGAQAGAPVIGRTAKPKPEGDDDEGDDAAQVQPKKSAAIVRPSVKGGYWQNVERKGAKWAAFHRRVLAREKGMREVAAKFLADQSERAIAAIKQAPSLTSLNRWTLLNLTDESDRYADAAAKWYEAAYRQAIAAGLQASRRKASVVASKDGHYTPDLEAALHRIKLKSGELITKTSVEQLIDLIEEAEAESMTVAELERAIRDKTKLFEPFRSRRIAVTESAKIENAGELEGYRQTEFVSLKGWLCAFVEQSREDHKRADEEYSGNPIPLDDDFLIGGEAMSAPGDPRASASQVCNCLCTLFPQVAEG